MIISGEEWISDYGDEAIVLIAGNSIKVAVFSHPYTRKKGDVVNSPLRPLDAKGICRSENQTLFAKRHLKGLGYDCCAVLRDREDKILEMDGLIFELDDQIPGDLENGDFVEFSCTRLDF